MRFNRLVTRLIASPAHHLVPRALTRVAYTGPVSGHAICLPVLSVVDGRRFLVLAGKPEHKRWWRTFRRARPARLTRAGRTYDVTGRLLAGHERAAAISAYVAARPRSGHGLAPDTPVVAFTPLLPWAPDADATG